MKSIDTYKEAYIQVKCRGFTSVFDIKDTRLRVDVRISGITITDEMALVALETIVASEGFITLQEELLNMYKLMTSYTASSKHPIISSEEIWGNLVKDITAKVEEQGTED